MTLTEFLLARIAEDETDIREDRNDFFAELRVTDKLLTECEAKRRIVEHAENATNGHVKLTAVQHCTWLAQPYADHPDFDPDWKLA